ncbi:hypothetical protein BKA70DRAFT_1424783 [Coprinopsis sp. MPI-PUGE-AT-0042]|nr:hypothetical protein BKA70DRAFT_1424783 [Coprinopsis sp. MPI-PUGE-AT-0042]
MYDGVPNHHLISAFNLISPAHLERLDINIECYNSSKALFYQTIYQLVSQIDSFRRLKQLILTLDLAPNDLILRFLERTPALRELQVHGYAEPWTKGLVPPHCAPLLEKLACPLDSARFFAPGRPINMLTIVADTMAWPDAQGEPQFLAPTEADLEAYMGPLCLPQISQLHLPSYPPLALMRVLMPYIFTRFPHLRELKCAISDASIGPKSREYARSSGNEFPMPEKGDTQYDVLEEDVKALAKEIRNDIETILSSSPADRSSSLRRETTLYPGSATRKPPTKNLRARLKAHSLGRVFAFLKVSMNKLVARHRGRFKSRNHPESLVQESPVQWSPSFESLVYFDRLSPYASHESLTALQLRLFPRPLISPPSMTFLDAYFGGVDATSGFPQRGPYHASHLLYFLIKGYYRLPESLQILELVQCSSGGLLEARASEHYALAERYAGLFDNYSKYPIEALTELSRRHHALSTLTVSNANIGYGWNSRTYKRDRVAELASQGQGPIWEYILSRT